MNRWQDLVRTFHRDVLDQPTSPAEPQIRHGELRARMLLEEAIETSVALIGSGATVQMLKEFHDATREAHREHADDPNLIEVIDGLCDVIVIACGTAEEVGVDLDPFYEEVMRTNMAKAGGPVRADGKRGKPPGWTPPDLATILDKLR